MSNFGSSQYHGQFFNKKNCYQQSRRGQVRADQRVEADQWEEQQIGDKDEPLTRTDLAPHTSKESPVGSHNLT